MLKKESIIIKQCDAKYKFSLISLSACFIVYYVVQYILSPLVYFHTQVSIIEVTTQASQQSGYAIFLIIVGLVSFLLGNFFFVSYRFRLSNFSFTPSLLKTLSYVIITFAIIMFCVLIRNVGGLSLFLNQQSDFKVTGMIGKGIYLYPTIVLIPIQIIWMLLITKFNAVRLTLQLFVMVLLFVLITIFIGFRGPIFVFSLSVIVFVHQYIKKLSFKILLPFFIIGYIFFVIGSAWQQAKSNHEHFISNPTIYKENWLNIFYRSNGLLVLNQTLAYKKHVKQSPSVFSVIKETTSIVIPRIIWYNKPIPLNRIYTKEVFGISNTSFSPTILGYICWILSPWFVIPCLFLLGSFFRTITEIHKKNKDNPLISLMFIVNFPFFILIAESPQTSFNQIFINTVTILLIYLPFSRINYLNLFKKSNYLGL